MNWLYHVTYILLILFVLSIVLHDMFKGRDKV